MPTNHTTLLNEALLLSKNGISVIPILPATKQGGDKKPAISWKRHQHTIANSDLIRTWFQGKERGIGIVCGNVSHHLVMLELEAEAAHHLATLSKTATKQARNHLWDKLTKGWFEATPTGGFHFYLRTETASGHGNQKLAQRINPDGTRTVLAETREEGGYTVIAPTDGRFHQNGKPWIRLAGGPTTIPVFSLEEYETLLNLFRTIDEQPAKPQPTTPIQAAQAAPQLPADPHAGITPGDHYEATTTWQDILTPHGWSINSQQGNETFWTRPGKNHGISASTGASQDRDRLYVFTTSTIFDAERPYTKFGAYALLNHAGDHHEAAKTLATKGYGKQAEHERDTTGLGAYIEELTQKKDTATPVATPTPDTSAQSVATGHATVATTDATTTDIFARFNITEPEHYSRTDDGNALRFADTHKNSLKYIPETKAWAAWNGHKWDGENGNAVATELAKDLARNLPEENKIDVQHKTRTLSRNGIQNLLNLAQTNRHHYAPLALFDADPYTLNTPAGPVDLRTGKQLEPDPTKRFLRATNIAPNWNQDTPLWHNFLAQTFTNNHQLIQYVQRLLGVSLIGKVHEQILPFFHGAGANGKSTMLNVVQRMIGIGQGGYSTTIPADIFLASAGNRHPADIASLSGARVAVTSETEEGQKFAEARVKLLTGADNISARFMGKDFFTFTPTHTVFLLSNHEPEVNSGGTAFWRRVRKVPFDNIVPATQRDTNLEQKLVDEGPGILAWMIQGARDYIQSGMEEPNEVRVATQAYELDQDSLRQFVEEQCTTGNPNQPGLQIKVSVFRDSYDRWCSLNGLEAVSANQVGPKLRKWGVETKRGGKGIRHYEGIVVAPEWDVSVSDDGGEDVWSALGGGR